MILACDGRATRYRPLLIVATPLIVLCAKCGALVDRIAADGRDALQITLGTSIL